MAHHLWIGFIGGFFAFAHCLGMCGGFVLHLSRERSRQRMLAVQFLWHSGRIFTYTFLGALAGYAGGMAEKLLHPAWLQSALSYVTGLVILSMGLVVLGLFPVRSNPETAVGAGFADLFKASFLISPSPGTALTLGLTTGCLPCPIVLGFLAYSLQTGSVAGGMTVMAGMGVGTLGPLLLLSAFGRLMGLHFRRWGSIAGGIILILLGIGTMLRGTAFYHRLFGCGAMPAVSHVSPIKDKKPACCSKEFGKH